MSAAYCRLAPGHPFHGIYHDTEYGFPARADEVLFERLVLEINQAGLSWLTVLKKREAFRAAFSGFEIDKVAGFGAGDVNRLLADPGIIRNRLKIEAVLDNARRLKEIRTRFGGFAAWLDAHHPLSKEKWVGLFRDTFRFTGGEIVGEFLMSLGYLRGAHVPSCPIQAKILARDPPWRRASRPGTAKNKARSV